MRKRVVKRYNMFYPQYLCEWKIFKYRRWKDYKYEVDINNPCIHSPHQTDLVSLRFVSKEEALRFLKDE